MKKRLGCLHAHYSNINYIEKALSSYDIDLVHFVDPALMYRVTSDKSFKKREAQYKVREQLEWISKSKVDAILITCTNYITLLQGEQLSISVPIINIDEPYFNEICKITEPQILLFTNPLTVEGTMNRLHKYADTRGLTLDTEVFVINDIFELMMQGKKNVYDEEVTTFITHLMKENPKTVSVAQLSMVDAAMKVERELSKTLVNPLNTLVDVLVKQLELVRTKEK